MTDLVILSASSADTGEWIAATNAAPYCAHSLLLFAREHKGAIIDIWNIDTKAGIVAGINGLDIDSEYLTHHRTASSPILDL